MTTASPPIPLKDHCSVIHDGVLYVYSPDAFQLIPLETGGKWSQARNGVSVEGAACVKGGTDGDNTKAALYVVGGVANSTSSTYPGLQRYSFLDKSWETITPVTSVTQDRQYHGAAYMNASSSLVVYGGSQNGYTGATSETFLMEMYPPYRVQAYSSAAAPAIKPLMFSWDEDRALMVGGGSSNVNIYTFGPGDGWQNLGLALPNALPDPSIAQSALLTLDDNSKILQTFRMDQTPTTVTTNVLLNPGGLPAAFGETVGESSTLSSPSSTATGTSKIKRSVFLNNFPAYNSTDAPTSTRKGFTLAQGDGGFLAFVGGDASDSVAFYNQTNNGWVSNAHVLGQQAETPSASASTSAAKTQATASTSPTASSTAAPSSHSYGKSNGLTVLGAVLGGICGAAAIIIIFLLWLRAMRRKKAEAENDRRNSHYLKDKRRSDEFDYEEGFEPLSKNGQPMGRSPVPSTIIPEADSTAMLGPRPSEKNLIRRVSSDAHGRLRTDMQSSSGQGIHQSMFRREKSPLSISRPMMPNLGDYKERPSIELGKATPAVAAATVAAAPVVASKLNRNASQRKTDEGWAKYFAGGRIDENSATYTSQNIASPPSRSRNQFWPGAGVPEHAVRTPRMALRDSAGNALEARSVNMASPSLENGPAGIEAKEMRSAQGMPARISNGSVESHGEFDENDYEDERVDTPFSSGIPSSVHDTHWNTTGDSWSTSPQRHVRHTNHSIGASDYPPTSSSGQTSGTGAASSGSKDSSLPSFPMPSQTIRPINPSIGSGNPGVQHPTAAHYGTDLNRTQPDADRLNYHLARRSDYFGNARSSQAIAPPDISTDVSWLNLGTPPTRKR